MGLPISSYGEEETTTRERVYCRGSWQGPGQRVVGTPCRPGPLSRRLGLAGQHWAAVRRRQAPQGRFKWRQAGMALKKPR